MICSLGKNIKPLLPLDKTKRKHKHMQLVTRVVTFGNELLPFACKFEIFSFGQDATKFCCYFTSLKIKLGSFLVITFPAKLVRKYVDLRKETPK